MEPKKEKPGVTFSLRNVKNGIGIIIFIIIVLSLIGKFKNTANENNDSKKNTITLKEIEDYMNNLTDAQFEMQWEPFRKNLYGKYVMWEGWVDNVIDQNPTSISGAISNGIDDGFHFGGEVERSKGFVIWVRPDPSGSLSSWPGISFELPKTAAVNLNKDEHITFGGTIDCLHKYCSTCNAHLKNVALIGK